MNYDPSPYLGGVCMKQTKIRFILLVGAIIVVGGLLAGCSPTKEDASTEGNHGDKIENEQKTTTNNNEPDTTEKQTVSNEAESKPETKSFTITGVDIAFETDEIVVNEGDLVTITFKNDGKLPHDLTLPEFGAKTETLDGGKTQTITFTANKAGTFEFYCSVTGHKEAGMFGKVVVN
jgi:plastocyanin